MKMKPMTASAEIWRRIEKRTPDAFTHGLFGSLTSPQVTLVRARLYIFVGRQITR